MGKLSDDVEFVVRLIFAEGQAIQVERGEGWELRQIAETWSTAAELIGANNERFEVAHASEEPIHARYGAVVELERKQGLATTSHERVVHDGGALFVEDEGRHAVPVHVVEPF